MTQAICTDSCRHQGGSVLLEALFGLFLAAVIGLGLSYAASRALFSQRYLNTQILAVSQLREAVANSGTTVASMCASGSGGTVEIGQTRKTLGVTCSTAKVTLTVSLPDRSNTNVREDSDRAQNAQDGAANGNPNALRVELPDNAIVTSLSLTVPADESTASLLGGDGKIEVSL